MKQKINIRSIYFICKTAYKAAIDTINHDGVEHAGYMAFLVLVSLFPFIVFFLVFTTAVGASDIGVFFIELAVNSLPENTTEIIRQRIQELLNEPAQRLMTLAIVGTIWTASSFVEGLRTILNKIYLVHSPPAYIFRRLLSILQFLLISIFLFLAMLIFVITPMILEKLPYFNDYLNKISLFWVVLRYFLIYMSLFLCVSALYYMLPNAKISYCDVVPGAILTVILWTLSGHLLSKYIIYYRQLNVIYGSLGSIIITLIFFYIVNMIFIYGAEFNYQLKCKDEAEISPQPDFKNQTTFKIY